MKNSFPRKPMSISRSARSFGHALRGIRTVLATQPNALLHLAIAVGVVALGLFLGISLMEWALVVICIATVVAAEAFNTALEFLADALEPDHNPLVGRAKDIAAGAVLLTSIGAVVVGMLVFIPHVLALISD